jgi:hypothetical protein
MDPKSFDGFISFLHLQDEASHMEFTYPQYSKREEELLWNISHFVQYVKNHWNCDIKELITNGEAALGRIFTNWRYSKTIAIHQSAPNTQQQNSIPEQSGRVIQKRIWALRIEAKLPAALWSEILKASVYIINRSPWRMLDWETPISLLYQKTGQEYKPNLANLKVLGSKAYVRRLNVPKSRKADPRAWIGYLVGFEGSTIYRIWNPKIRRVYAVKRSRDVIFDEDSLYNPENPFLPELEDKVPEFIEPQNIIEL